MSDYLKSLAQRRKKESPVALLWEVAQAFAEADPQSAVRTAPRACELYDLVRFVKFDSIASWLREDRDVVERALAFSQTLGDEKLSKILASALEGTAQPAAVFSAKLPGCDPHVLEVDAGEVTKFDGKNWGGTDIALSFAMNNYEAALLDELINAADELDLDPPLTVRRRTKANQSISSAMAGRTAADLFKQLVSKRNPLIEAGSWEDAKTRTYGKGARLPIKHVVNSAASHEDLVQAEKMFGPSIKDLLGIYALNNGGELFQHQGDCGFYLAPLEQWPELHSDAVEWAESVTWQNEMDQIPSYLYSAVAFGMIPGNSERWLLITEGDYAGAIMLSDTDLIEGEPRFKNISEFMSTLINDTGRILNSGGFVRYEIQGKVLFPIRCIT